MYKKMDVNTNVQDVHVQDDTVFQVHIFTSTSMSLPCMHWNIFIPLRPLSSWVVVEHAFNLNTWESEEGKSLSLRPIWSTEEVPGQSRLHRETLYSPIKKPCLMPLCPKSSHASNWVPPTMLLHCLFPSTLLLVTILTPLLRCCGSSRQRLCATSLGREGDFKAMWTITERVPSHHSFFSLLQV